MVLVCGSLYILGDALLWMAEKETALRREAEKTEEKDI